MKRLAIVSISCLLLAGCTAGSTTTSVATPTPTPLTPAEQAALDEVLFQESNDWSTVRVEAREAGASFVREQLPRWDIKGIRSEPYDANVYGVSVDIQQGDKRETVDLYVEKYFPEQGEPYWKARIMSKALMDVLHESEDRKKLRQLNELKREKADRENNDDDDAER